MNPETKKAKTAFQRQFGDDTGIKIVRAPGRVNLIGEHTDYNGGFVLPMAIDFGITVAGRPRDDRTINLYSVDYNETASVDLGEKFSGKNPRWSLYVEGTARVFDEEFGGEINGFDAIITGNVPQGAGLSSSAALEVATGFFINEIHNLKVHIREIALTGQKAENDYLGVRCGIMDQFASALCEEEAALFLDCRSLEYEQVPMKLGEYVFLILDTRKSRGLVDSAYNDRRRACEEGVRLFQQWAPGIELLRDVTPEIFEEYSGRLPEDVMKKCRHVVTENSRVSEAVKCLKSGGLAGFGKLMWASHDSLRDDYEVSCEELDALNEIAREFGGVAGERMTGAGFGGCGVALVEKAAEISFIEEMEKQYRKRTGKTPEIYATGAAGGVRCLEG